MSAASAPRPILCGIGSRQTPAPICDHFTHIARQLRQHGYRLRSGGAQGADTAFELGFEGAGAEDCEIFLPWRGFNGRDNGITPTSDQMHACMEVVSSVHPAWRSLTPAARKLHARNACQVLGLNLASPCTFVLCWTPDGCERHSERGRHTGGTGTAISLASLAQIPVINAARSDWYARLQQLAPQLTWAGPLHKTAPHPQPKA